jgi:hypothetical protein
MVPGRPASPPTPDPPDCKRLEDFSSVWFGPRCPDQLRTPRCRPWRVELVEVHRPDDVLRDAGREGHVSGSCSHDQDLCPPRLGDVPIDPNIDGDVSHQPTSQLGQPLRFDLAERL